MRLVILILLAVMGMAQTLPTLPATNTVVGTAITCTFESTDTIGGLSANCTTLPDGVIAYTAVVSPSEDGVIVGHGQIMCLYWTESAGKYRLQCGDTSKVVLDGYMPPVQRKKRWWLFWR